MGSSVIVSQGTVGFCVRQILMNVLALHVSTEEHVQIISIRSRVSVWQATVVCNVRLRLITVPLSHAPMAATVLIVSMDLTVHAHRASGTQCQTDIEECASRPCQNTGTCVDGVNEFTCICRDGYTGSVCQTDINECASQPCENSGTCVDHVNGFTCICLAGHSGAQCQTDINECASQPCM